MMMLAPFHSFLDASLQCQHHMNKSTSQQDMVFIGIPNSRITDKTLLSKCASRAVKLVSLMLLYEIVQISLFI